MQEGRAVLEDTHTVVLRVLGGPGPVHLKITPDQTSRVEGVSPVRWNAGQDVSNA